MNIKAFFRITPPEFVIQKNEYGYYRPYHPSKCIDYNDGYLMGIDCGPFKSYYKAASASWEVYKYFERVEKDKKENKEKYSGKWK